MTRTLRAILDEARDNYQRSKAKERLREAKGIAQRAKTMTPERFMETVLRTEADAWKAKVRMAGMLTGPGQDPLQTTRLTHSMIGICDEAGEFAKHLKRHFYYGQDLNVPGIVGELGDLLWYVFLGCHAAGVPVELVMAKIDAKLRSRYPEKFTEQLAHGRDIAAEQLAMSAVDDKEALTKSISVEDVLDGEDPTPPEEN